jgi:thioester reductase-like protein
VRKQYRRAYRIYRPAIVLGDSKTGEIDKIDGRTTSSACIKKMRAVLPQWMPTIGVEGSRVNVVPVDFVVDAMDHIAHKKAGRRLLPPGGSRLRCARARC